jgi:hypothetical protein
MDEKPTPQRRDKLFSERNLQLGLALVLFGLAGAVGVMWIQAIRGSKDGRVKDSPLPEAHPIWDSWRAAEAGDIEKYLGCFTGAARARLEGEVATLGRAAFKQRLQKASAAAEGIQLCPPKPSEDTAIIFPVVVRHGDEGELSDYIVVQVGKEWKIRAVVSHGRVQVVPSEDEPPTKQGDKT